MEEMINGAEMECSEEIKMNDNLYDYFGMKEYDWVEPWSSASNKNRQLISVGGISMIISWIFSHLYTNKGKSCEGF